MICHRVVCLSSDNMNIDEHQQHMMMMVMVISVVCCMIMVFFQMSGQAGSPQTCLVAVHHKNDAWGWVVVLASFVVHVIVGGICYSGAIWLMLLRRYFDQSRYDAVCLGTILLAVTTLGGQHSFNDWQYFGCSTYML